MAHPQAPSLPAANRKASFLPHLLPITEKDLAGDGEYFRVGKSGQQRFKKTGIYLHIVVQQHYNIVLGGANTGIRSTPKTLVFLEL